MNRSCIYRSPCQIQLLLFKTTPLGASDAPMHSTGRVWCIQNETLKHLSIRLHLTPACVRWACFETSLLTASASGETYCAAFDATHQMGIASRDEQQYFY